MTGQEPSGALVALARRLSNDPRYMSYVLAAYQRQENLTDEELAQELGTLPALVVRLALCKRPGHSPIKVLREVRELADYTLTDEGQLAALLRQVDGLEKLVRRPTVLTGVEDEAQSSHPLTGLLAAARDRDESTDDESSPEEEANREE